MEGSDDDWLLTLWDEVSPAVIDVGSGFVKAGFAAEVKPRRLIPSVFGRRKPTDLPLGMERDHYIGDEAIHHHKILNLTEPFMDGHLVEVFDHGLTWYFLHHSFYNELCVCPEEHPISLVLSPRVSYSEIGELSQLLFETGGHSFSCPFVYLASSTTMSLFSAGKATGVVLDLGHSEPISQTIIEGSPVDDSLMVGTTGGRDLTRALSAFLLRSTTESFAELPAMELEQLSNRMKCDLFRVALDPLAIEKAAPATFKLPDGTEMLVGPERYRIPEMLFQPESRGDFLDPASEDVRTLPQQVLDSVAISPMDHRSTLYQNVVLVGGSSLIPGLPERFESDLRGIAEEEVQVFAPPERRFGSWAGLSFFASLDQFRNLALSKKEYDEVGPEGALLLRTKFPGFQN